MGFDQLPLHRAVLEGDIEIHYTEAGSGPALVFIHGGMGDWSVWQPQWPAFTSRFRCITYSRRYSSPNRNRISGTDHSVRDEAKDLSALLSHWQAPPVILIGTSYGAYTALQLALDAPSQVRALVLTEPPVLPFADLVAGGREARIEFEREILDPAAQAYAAGDAERAVRVLTLGINGSGPGEAATTAGLERRLRNAEAMRALALSSDPYPALDKVALGRLRIPTLLLTGEGTMPIHRATTAGLSALLPYARLSTVPASGHGVHRDNPAAFNEIVLAYLHETLEI